MLISYLRGALSNNLNLQTIRTEANQMWVLFIDKLNVVRGYFCNQFAIIWLAIIDYIKARLDSGKKDDVLGENNSKLKIGSMLKGQYEILEVLGYGGFGITYLVRDHFLPSHPIRVLKQLCPKTTNVQLLKIAERLFYTEASCLEKLGNEHPQIPTLYSFFADDNNFFIIQEFIEGKTLNLKERIFSELEIIELLIQILEVLVYVHKTNVIHRDITPNNIIIRQFDNQVTLIDFGCVKKVNTFIDSNNNCNASNRTVIVGTPGYMAPEQEKGNPVLKSDIYALGRIGFEAFEEYDQPLQISKKFKLLLNKMVSHQYRERPSASEALRMLQELQKSYF